MKYDIKATYFKPEKQGISHIDNKYRFACKMNQSENIGIIIYTPDGGKQKFPFLPEGKSGSLFGIQLSGEGLESCLYNFYQDNDIFTDPYAKAVAGLEQWGLAQDGKRETKAYITLKDYDWQNDEVLMTPYEDTIIYGLNVRAFTIHKSSGVKNKGTFEGIIEKIPYLKELGITAVELMPCYEYEECLFPYRAKVNDSMQDTTRKCAANSDCLRLNCWGFQSGFYLAPKASYSAINDCCTSFKNLVKELHKNKIEIFMQFYFPADVRWITILEILQFWVKDYHIDGFRISGNDIPYKIILEDALLRNTKLWFTDSYREQFKQYTNDGYKNIALDHYGFREDIRRFLKGDEGLINKALYYQKCNPISYSVINFLADYDGYSLYDMVSYERKHNENNGEDNRDGTDLNFSWNCGSEGETRKKAVCELRKKQMKNALSFLFMSQGVPFLFAGDEFANTRFGNNNAYCQDNEVGWIKWKKNQLSEEISDCVKYLIQLRKTHRILHMTNELKVMDYESLGYPDISYHGSEAWRPDLGYNSRILGIMLCGKYVSEQEDDSFYIAINMHWEPHTMALPRLPKGESWNKIFDTCNQRDEIIFKQNNIQEENEKEDLVQIHSRCIMIFQSEKGTENKKTTGRKTNRKKIN